MQAPNINEFLDSLTTREKEILVFIADGLTSNEIAAMLFRAESTVKKHREHILQKANVKGTSAIRKFIREIKPHLN